MSRPFNGWQTSPLYSFRATLRRAIFGFLKRVVVSLSTEDVYPRQHRCEQSCKMGVMPGPFLRTASYACSRGDFLKPAASCHGIRCRNKPGAVDIELRFCQRKVSLSLRCSHITICKLLSSSWSSVNSWCPRHRFSMPSSFPELLNRIHPCSCSAAVTFN